MSKRLVTIIAILLFLCAVTAMASAEDVYRMPATPTDMECPHLETKTTIYFFDSPAYTPLGADGHRVEGPAVIETVCLECGEVLSSEEADHAEETRPHTLKKGVCALCGWHEPKQEQTPAPARKGKTNEQTIFLSQETEAGFYTMTLTEKDLGDLFGANVSVILIREKSWDAAIALDVAEILNLTEKANASLSVEMAEREDGSVFAALSLVNGTGRETAVTSRVAVLRFYRTADAPARVCFAPADEDRLEEAEGTWQASASPNTAGYWIVPYTKEGTYMLLK